MDLFFSDKYTRFCQWKNLELNIQLTMNDFSVHRIIGRGGFGEVSAIYRKFKEKIPSFITSALVVALNNN